MIRRQGQDVKRGDTTNAPIEPTVSNQSDQHLKISLDKCYTLWYNRVRMKITLLLYAVTGLDKLMYGLYIRQNPMVQATELGKYLAAQDARNKAVLLKRTFEMADCFTVEIEDYT